MESQCKQTIEALVDDLGFGASRGSGVFRAMDGNRSAEVRINIPGVTSRALDPRIEFTDTRDGVVEDEIKYTPDTEEETMAALSTVLDKAREWVQSSSGGSRMEKDSRNAHRLDGTRGHKLMPAAVARKIPAIYSQENEKDPTAWVKLFSPYSGAVWYITEYDPSTGQAFGWADLGMGGGELGYISIRELEGLHRRGLPLVERDLYWKPMPLSRAKSSRMASGNRAALIRLASTLPAQDPDRKALLALVQRTASAWQKQDIEIQTATGPVEVRAQVTGNWAVHKPIRGSGASITLLPSGVLVAKAKSVKAGAANVENMLRAYPRLLNATERDVRSAAIEVLEVLDGRVPIGSILRQCGLTTLGEMSMKAGTVWGIKGSSMRIRVGARDVVLMEWSGRYHYGKVEGSWGALELINKKKITEATLRSWCDQIKRAPTTVELRAEIRGDK